METVLYNLSPRSPPTQVRDYVSMPVKDMLTRGPWPGLVMNDTDLFADFLKDIIYSGNDAGATEPSQAAPFNPMSMDILDFGPLHGMFPQIRGESSWCYPPMTCQDYSHSEWPADGTNRGNIISSEYAFRQSLWSWTPKEGDHWRSETTELRPCLDDLVSDFTAQNPQTCASTPLLASTRHRLISMMLSVSGTGDYERIMSTFPSLTTLDYLLSKDLQRRSIELDSWIHIATFDPNLACPQLVLGIIISGAFRCSHPLLWKLGLAMLELHLELCLRLVSPRSHSTVEGAVLSIPSSQATIEMRA
jgi:hypothetical protein